MGQYWFFSGLYPHLNVYHTASLRGWQIAILFRGISSFQRNTDPLYSCKVDTSFSFFNDLICISTEKLLNPGPWLSGNYSIMLIKVKESLSVHSINKRTNKANAGSMTYGNTGLLVHCLLKLQVTFLTS